MCGKAYDPRFIFAYPNARISVMGGSQASNVLLDIKLRQLEKQGKTLTNDEKQSILDEIRESYEESSNALHAAARLWVDEVIDPAKTRYYITRSIEIANHNPEIPKFNVGVIQT
jgi:acetyl-CoA carboxylase carboxyltransferase component